MAIVIINLTPMPPGLTLAPDGTISGKPTASFTGSVQIQAADGAAIATGVMQFAIDLPQVPVPPIVQRHEFEDLTKYTATPNVVKTVEIFSTPTIDRLTVGPIVQLSDFSTPTIEDNLRRLSDFSTPTFESNLRSLSDFSTPTIEDALRRLSDFSTPFIDRAAALPPVGGFSPAIAAPLGTAGLVQIGDAANGSDDEVVNVGDLGFDFFIFGTNARTTTGVCANSHMGFTFSTPANNWNSFAEDYPNQIGLYIGAGDWSWTSCWAANTGGKFRIRLEGPSDRSGAPPVTNVWEVTLFPNGVIMLVTGVFDHVGYNAIQSGVTGGSVPFTIEPNTSRVFTPVPAGMFTPATFTVQTGSYS